MVDKDSVEGKSLLGESASRNFDRKTQNMKKIKKNLPAIGGCNFMNAIQSIDFKELEMKNTSSINTEDQKLPKIFEQSIHTQIQIPTPKNHIYPA